MKLLPLKLENEEEVLEQARELNPGAWSDCIKELKGETPTDACQHTKILNYCAECGKKFT
jgi:hypothetical protein